VLGRTSSLYCSRVYKKWRVAGSNTACISHPLCAWSTGGCPDKKTIYRWVLNFRQTLEALKEAIGQEVAAITPEIVLNVMDNYREATSVHQYSRPPIE